MGVCQGAGHRVFGSGSSVVGVLGLSPSLGVWICGFVSESWGSFGLHGSSCGSRGTPSSLGGLGLGILRA